jgi:hypothetical protein
MNSSVYRCVIVLLVTVTVAGVSDRVLLAEIPPQIDDRVFWQLVNEMSETDGVFTSENLVSNEPNFQAISNKAKQERAVRSITRTIP